MSSLSSRAKDTPLAVGVTIFAAAMLILAGFSQLLLGIAALVNDTFLVRVEGYIFSFDATVWGGIQLILGLAFVVLGWFIFRAATWAIGIGIGLAILNALMNFIWLPYSPIQAVLLIALDLLVVWALATINRS